MFGSFLSALGGHIGSAFGGGIFSSIGRYAGKLIGDYIDSKDVEIEETVKHKGHILNNLYIQSSSYGKPIALIYGKAKIAGNIIWAEPIKEILNKNTIHKYLSRGSREVISHNYEFTYFLSFALALCEGEIDIIEKVWIGDEMVDLSLYNHRIYKGSEDQLPDHLIEKHMGIGKTPAFRGICYIVFEQFPLAEFNNRVPNFTFEVIRPIKTFNNNPEVENLIKSMIIIPGSGEYVYDTNVQYKYKYLREIKISEESINCHNPKKVADAIYTLDSLQETCPNIEWVAPVVCWFGNSLDIAGCNLYPAVEYNDEGVTLSESWSVAGKKRNNAEVISYNKLGSPNYGGTINDASLIRYLDEVKRRNLKILFYPMFFLDLPGKPWRGNLTGNSEYVHSFFNKADGYNNFILHYANLVRGRVDAFIIGSELKKLTTIRSINGEFPVVNELINLAKKVKEILGPSVKITYAADWSEYHNDSKGWYHLDDLWSSEYIDFIGIDAYFPLTDTATGGIKKEDIEKGWVSGEGADYYYDSNGVKQELTSSNAWKNIKYWWENDHYQPDGTKTSWQPKSKKIWFTEYGFPSVDKAPNQPNIFYDPNCIDGGVPKYSTGDIDFVIQKKSIKATIEVVKKMEFIENIFLWCWDARPYPAWPHGMYWSDGYLWERGHWVNGKFGTSSLAAVISDLCIRGGIERQYIDISEIDDSVHGVVFNNPLSISDTIHMLRCAYFYDFSFRENIIKFCKRGLSHYHANIHYSELITKDKNYINLFYNAEQKIPRTINLNYIDQALDYDIDIISSTYDFPRSNVNYNVRLPIILSRGEAERISLNILFNSRNETIIFDFILPLKYIFLNASNIIKLNLDKKTYTIRIRTMSIKGMEIAVNAIIENVNSYLPHAPSLNNLPIIKKSLLQAIMLPCLNMANDRINILFTINGKEKEKLYISNNQIEYIKFNDLRCNSSRAKIIKYQNKYSDFGLIDNFSDLIIFSKALLYKVSDEDFWSGKNLLIFGEEIISYREVIKLEENIYKLNGLIRGVYGTNIQANIDDSMEVLITNNPLILPIYNISQREKLWFKTSSSDEVMIDVAFPRLQSPIIHSYKLNNGIIDISWFGRNNALDNWRTPYISEVSFYRITIKHNNNIILTEKVKELKFSFNFLEHSLSGAIEIYIIADADDREESLPSIVNVNLLNI
jgi:hypothetical protein